MRITIDMAQVCTYMYVHLSVCVSVLFEHLLRKIITTNLEWINLYDVFVCYIFTTKHLMDDTSGTSNNPFDLSLRSWCHYHLQTLITVFTIKNNVQNNN